MDRFRKWVFETGFGSVITHWIELLNDELSVGLGSKLTCGHFHSFSLVLGVEIDQKNNLAGKPRIPATWPEVEVAGNTGYKGGGWVNYVFTKLVPDISFID